ncbi:antibiotic biosynthesis monooxygenase [Pikeienuella piscinae]|uniref:Antibiotic biosynthesis monooxygenase n=1 Tax=Pikeienuella piscinae TaxID=2748098 RepID=A0A7L5C2A7_9RHOB|nr:putative quinol monooxygenase [Pikeienuella piscinae]QIE56009.1 antibiotic biosynthesis monooxygenase [Pikeienuella piscinae]
MPAFTVLAIHRVKAGMRATWAELATVNAEAARSEPGCLQFDVVLSDEEPNMAFLVEMYVDRAAWDAHLQKPYCRSFMSAIETMLVDRTRMLGGRVET